MLADYRSFERLGTFRPTPMIGGSQAIREPWRSTYAHVVQAVGWERLDTLPGTRGLRDFLAKRSLAIFDRMLATGLNVPRASSCGRLFDAVAAALGICRENAQFEGQGAMILEAIVDRACLRDNDPGYEFAVTTDIDSQILVLESAPMWLALFADLAAETPLSRVSARFHRGLAKAVVEMVRRTTASCIGAVTASPRVVLSGGCFQNRVLLEAVTAGLESDGFECLSHRSVPTNDGGVALGQAAIAAARHLLPAQSA